MMIMNMKITAALLTTFVAVVAADEGSCKTIYEIVCDTDGLENFCGLIQSTNIEDKLSNENDSLTVFAPTNDAISSISYVVMGDEEQLRDILLFHIHDGALFMDSVDCDAGQNLLRMTSGRDSRTICDEFVPIWQKGGGNSDDNKPTILSKDISACNGVVHIIDTVMLPGQYDGVDTGLNEPEAKLLSQGSAQLRYTGFYALVSLLLSSVFLFN